MGAEAVLAFAASAASFALTSAILAANGSDLLAAAVAVLATIAVIAISRGAGAGYALPVVVAVLVAFDWYFVPPTHPDRLPGAADLGYLLAFLVVGVLIGEMVARAGRRADTSESARSELAGEQAALRRVATLVASGEQPDSIFPVVAKEVGVMLGLDAARAVRVLGDDEILQLEGWTAAGLPPLPVGPAKLEDSALSTEVKRTGGPVQIDDYASLDRFAPVLIGDRRIRSGVAAPIFVGGCLWGAMMAASLKPRQLPADARPRLADFTELVAMAISNAEAQAEAGRLGEEQAALRRVATLVARGCSPTEVFAQVAEEVGLCVGVETAAMLRFEADGDGTLVAKWGELPGNYRMGMRVNLQGESVTATVRDTWRPARMDDYSEATGEIAELARETGALSCVGTPIIVDGALWGSIAAMKLRGEPLPAGTECRIGEFTELVATAISNVQARAELARSRARIVAASEEERRRLVRDLHDGAQQRLVHTILSLKQARRALDQDDAAAPMLLSRAQQHAEEATDELRELAHGIMPLVLTSGGLRAGVVALASRCPIPVKVDVAVDRMPPSIESTAYFLAAEALTNVAKHACADHAEVRAQIGDEGLEVEVRDDGVGGACPDGSGLTGLADRLDVIEGCLRVDSPPGGGTLVAAVIPLTPSE